MLIKMLYRIGGYSKYYDDHAKVNTNVNTLEY